ncbi:tRNA pseudouridine(55) synthase [Trifolium repens]|nr:tRNA pseudouridine(55) synthase [Trifolium repens]
MWVQFRNLDCCFLLFATKQYAALVWISRPLKDEDFQHVSSVKDLKVLQRTPIRVLHRRSPLEREKIIHWMKIEAIAGSSQYFLLHLCTRVWFYIPSCVDENSQ